MKNLETIAVHESKGSDKVVKFVELSVSALSQYCSKKYAKSIVDAHDNGGIWGVYFTASGRIKAIFN